MFVQVSLPVLIVLAATAVAQEHFLRKNGAQHTDEPTPPTHAHSTFSQTPAPTDADPCEGCPTCVHVPGNPQDVTDKQCFWCANGTVAWWPCNKNGLCQCAPTPSPTLAPTPPPTALTPDLLVQLAKAAASANDATPEQLAALDAAEPYIAEQFPALAGQSGGTSAAQAYINIISYVAEGLPPSPSPTDRKLQLGSIYSMGSDAIALYTIISTIFNAFGTDTPSPSPLTIEDIRNVVKEEITRALDERDVRDLTTQFVAVTDNIAALIPIVREAPSVQSFTHFLDSFSPSDTCCTGSTCVPGLLNTAETLIKQHAVDIKTTTDNNYKDADCDDDRWGDDCMLHYQKRMTDAVYITSLARAFFPLSVTLLTYFEALNASVVAFSYHSDYSDSGAYTLLSGTWSRCQFDDILKKVYGYAQALKAFGNNAVCSIFFGFNGGPQPSLDPTNTKTCSMSRRIAKQCCTVTPFFISCPSNIECSSAEGQGWLNIPDTFESSECGPGYCCTHWLGICFKHCDKGARNQECGKCAFNPTQPCYDALSHLSAL